MISPMVDFAFKCRGLLTLGVLAVCFSSIVVAESVNADTHSLPPLSLQQSTSVNTLAQDLLLTRLRHGGMSNALVSSVSLYYALAILAEGAEGETLEVLRNLLLKDEQGDVAAIATVLAKTLTSPFNEGDSRGAFALSNSLWANGGSGELPEFFFSEDFLAAAANFYGAVSQTLDFDSPDSPRVINDWADEKTRGLIPAVIDHETLKGLDWAILNAAVFEGAWGTQMRRFAAEDGFRFSGIDGISNAVESIRTMDYSSSVTDLDDGSVAFHLPFLGNKYAFFVHLSPQHVGDVGEWLLQESIPNTDRIIAATLSSTERREPLMVQLPVFTLSDSIEMQGDNSPMAMDLGMENLFNEKAAEFGRLSDLPSYVEIIKQDARLEFDEDGVRAAAVTLIGGIKATSVLPPRAPREILVDRPFGFAIVENDSNAILFNGVVTSMR